MMNVIKLMTFGHDMDSFDNYGNDNDEDVILICVFQWNGGCSFRRWNLPVCKEMPVKTLI